MVRYSQPLVSIIVLNWNGQDDTIQCLKSLFKIDYKNYKVVVVDNGSEQNEIGKLRKMFHSNNVIFKRLEKNIGYAGGCNYGLSISKKWSPSYFLLLNNDTKVNPNFLDYLVGIGEEVKDAGIVSPVIYDYFKKNKIIWSKGKFNWLTARFYHGTSKINGIYDSLWVTGCAMLIKKCVVDKVGLLDNVFFAYFEDVAYCLETKRNGFKCLVDSRAKVFHKVSASSKKDSNLYTYLFSRNRILFVNNYTTFFYKIYFFLFNLLKTIIVVLYFVVNHKRYRAIAFLRGYYDGIRNKGGFILYGK